MTTLLRLMSDSDEEPDATDEKEPIVEEGDSCTNGGYRALLYLFFAIFFTCIILHNLALHKGRH